MGFSKAKADAMTSLKSAISANLALACSAQGWAGGEMLTIAFAVVHAMVAGMLQGITLQERAGQISEAEAEQAIAELQQFYGEIRDEEYAHIVDLFSLAAIRNDRDALLRYEANLKARMVDGTPPMLSRDEFDRAMNGRLGGNGGRN